MLAILAGGHRQSSTNRRLPFVNESGWRFISPPIDETALLLSYCNRRESEH